MLLIFNIDLNSNVAGGHGSGDVSKEMYISNDVAGSVNGKSGSKVAEIRKISGAYVRISSEDKVSRGRGSSRCWAQRTASSLMCSQAENNYQLSLLQNFIAVMMMSEECILLTELN